MPHSQILMWLALTLIFFVAFLASLFAVARLGFDAKGNWQRGGKYLIGSAAISLVIWLFALSRVPAPYPLENLKRYELPK